MKSIKAFFVQAILVSFSIGLISSAGHASIDNSLPENESIYGILKDTNEEPVSGALVALSGTSFSDTSDESGEFEITGISPGTYTLVVTHPQYYSEQRTVEVQLNEQKFVIVEDLVGL